MDNAKDLFGYDSLAFFGKVNASISHELKNVMAIISETAGLLGDLSDMASTGTPLEPDMLKSCTNSIIEEIQRGFLTIRQMNRFAHSADTPAEAVNLMDVLDLAINLSGYLSFAGKVYLNPCQGVSPTVLTCPFLLQAIVYQAMVYTFKTTGPGAEITISLKAKDDAAWRIFFSGFSGSGFQMFPDVATSAMAASIGVAIRFEPSDDRLVLEVPLTIESAMAHHIAPDISDKDNTPQTRS